MSEVESKRQKKKKTPCSSPPLFPLSIDVCKFSAALGAAIGSRGSRDTCCAACCLLSTLTTDMGNDCSETMAAPSCVLAEEADCWPAEPDPDPPDPPPLLLLPPPFELSEDSMPPPVPVFSLGRPPLRLAASLLVAAVRARLVARSPGPASPATATFGLTISCTRHFQASRDEGTSRLFNLAPSNSSFL